MDDSKKSAVENFSVSSPEHHQTHLVPEERAGYVDLLTSDNLDLLARQDLRERAGTKCHVSNGQYGIFRLSIVPVVVLVVVCGSAVLSCAREW